MARIMQTALLALALLAAFCGQAGLSVVKQTWTKVQ